MASTRKNAGPWTHRLFIYFFTALFAILVYWLLGFIVTDIATWPGPDYQQIERRIVDQSLTKESASLQAQVEEANRDQIPKRFQIRFTWSPFSGNGHRKISPDTIRGRSDARFEGRDGLPG